MQPWGLSGGVTGGEVASGGVIDDDPSSWGMPGAGAACGGVTGGGVANGGKENVEPSFEWQPRHATAFFILDSGVEWHPYDVASDICRALARGTHSSNDATSYSSKLVF
jgi:hypothetical protein